MLNNLLPSDLNQEINLKTLKVGNNFIFSPPNPDSSWANLYSFIDSFDVGVQNGNYLIKKINEELTDSNDHLLSLCHKIVTNCEKAVGTMKANFNEKSDRICRKANFVINIYFEVAL